ncbi:hypothetical protein KSP35_22525 [Aquihabitans sp. G128]|uniref:hypothetical protein n=1 Tax=Aquihabitans sp. G128 TaxID=2849779 RepID=UPI001C220E8E|nr:hypothetical protein [Aquihabitans sp. G128]QXC61052.1 hypothetical protein KSP35_22525 [Aquihabitans sp. G128]
MAALALCPVYLVSSAAGTPREPLALLVAVGVAAWFTTHALVRHQMTSAARALDTEPLRVVHLVPAWIGGLRRQFCVEVRAEDSSTLGWIRLQARLDAFDPTVPFHLPGGARHGRRAALRSVDGRQLVLPLTPLQERPVAPVHPQSALVDRLAGWTRPGPAGVAEPLRGIGQLIAKRRGEALALLVMALWVGTSVVWQQTGWPPREVAVLAVLTYALVKRPVLRLCSRVISRPLNRAVREVTGLSASDAAFVGWAVEAFCHLPALPDGVTPAVPPPWAGIAAPTTFGSAATPSAPAAAPLAPAPASVDDWSAW